MEGLDRSRDVSLYIHVPYCYRKCDYCAFYSTQMHETLDDYFSVLLRQIDVITKQVGKPFYTVFIGGGNPGVLGNDRLLEIAKAATRYGRPQEFTTELNPESVSADTERLTEYFDRISIGVQSFSDDVLRTLGRNASSQSATEALEILSDLKKRKGIRVNGDIITSVSGFSADITLSDIRKLSSYGADHVSLYSLSLEEGTPLAARMMPCDEESDRECLVKSWALLKELGFEHYEISNFAIPGSRSLHNSVYWHLGQYIGLGPSAESSLGWNECVSLRQKESVDEYLADPSFDACRLTLTELGEEYLLTSLRTSDGIGKDEYRERFSEDFDERFSAFINDLDPTLYINTGKRFSLTEEGFLVLDRIILSLAMAL
ncbi:MAG: coproporphyrinogen-III oxidase family protein [Bullifex sp.]